MTSSVYLDMLDELFRPGIARLSARFVEVQVRFVAGCQQPDGGFVGRQGRSDGYYTDFALRTLAWLVPEHAAFDRAAGYVARLSWPPRDMVECFNILNARRLLARRAAGTASGLRTVDGSPGGERAAQRRRRPSTRCWRYQWLYEHLLPRGGFARLTHDERVSAYHTFLGGLCSKCRESICRPATMRFAPSRPSVAPMEAMRSLPVNRFSDQRHGGGRRISSDARRLAAGASGRRAQFLARMQSADGGLKASSRNFQAAICSQPSPA